MRRSCLEHPTPSAPGTLSSMCSSPTHWQRWGGLSTAGTSPTGNTKVHGSGPRRHHPTLLRRDAVTTRHTSRCCFTRLAMNVRRSARRRRNGPSSSASCPTAWFKVQQRPMRTRIDKSSYFYVSIHQSIYQSHSRGFRCTHLDQAVQLRAPQTISLLRSLAICLLLCQALVLQALRLDCRHVTRHKTCMQKSRSVTEQQGRGA
jgi:hypothetical protein